MRKRCNDPNHKSYKDYGGRGITVCERWVCFENFLVDMGPRLSPKHEIDRINNEKGYEPGNCRWVLPVAQANNRRGNHLLTIGGQTLTVAEWALPYGGASSSAGTKTGSWCRFRE